MDKFKRLLPTILMIAIEIAIGIMLLIDGEKLTWIIFIGFGSILLLLGVISLIAALMGGKKSGSIRTGQLVMAVLMMAIGAFFAAASGSVTEVVTSVTLIYGIILIISGVFKLADYFAFRSFAGAGNVFVVISALISIIFGVIIAFNPFGSALVIWTIMGIAILVSAFLDIITLIIFGKLVRELTNEV